MDIITVRFSSLSYSQCHFPSCSMAPPFKKRLTVQSGYSFPKLSILCYYTTHANFKIILIIGE